MEKTKNVHDYFLGLDSVQCRNGKQGVAVEMTPYTAYQRSKDPLVADGRVHPVFLGGKVQYVLLRQAKMNTDETWKDFPFFSRTFLKAGKALDEIQKKYGNLKRHLGVSLAEITNSLKLSKEGTWNPPSLDLEELEEQKAAIQSELQNLTLRQQRELEEVSGKLKEEKGIFIGRSGNMHAIMLRCDLMFNTPENVGEILPQLKATYLLGNGLPLFTSDLGVFRRLTDRTKVVVHTAICIIGADEVFARIILDTGEILEFDTTTGNRIGAGDSHCNYTPTTHALSDFVEEFKDRICSLTFFETRTGPTAQALAELQRGLTMARTLERDLYCTLPGEQYKQQMAGLLKPLIRAEKEEIAQIAMDNYSAIVDRVAEELYLPFIKSVSRQYRVKTFVAVKGSLLDRALARFEEFVFSRYARLWQEADTPAFRKKVMDLVTRSFCEDQAASHRIEAPFRYILYHLAVPYAALGMDGLTGDMPVVKIETKGVAEITSTIAARRLAKDLGFKLEMAMLTQPYVPSIHGDRMHYFSPHREKVFLNLPESWLNLTDDQAFTLLRHLDIDPDELRNLAVQDKKGAAGLLTQILDTLHDSVQDKQDSKRERCSLSTTV
ncbi:MAG: hypothetical protein GY737_24405 [Desulfobacteraceae bacterium]|nr:hypothetical protein [Desulfobacteraceae bacterium]